LQPHLVGQPCYKLETANCLSMCALGPNLVIYPDNLVFNWLNEAKLAEVIREHIKPCDSG
ncbi:MAG: (2Fe-2S) ferredoxin domain-containing protein, partial [Chloroflexota bacterium]